jgi:predicted O-methyltransferase YrrM
LLNGAMKWKESPPSVDDGWGSHVGALRAIAKALPIKVVVEYGSGKFSTPLFLDRTAFPDLEFLTSVESDPEWLAKVREMCGQDSRLEQVFRPIGTFHTTDSVPRSPDLVFIDCDEVRDGRHDYSARLKLIERFAADPTAVVVVHDANFADIRPAVLGSAFKYKATYVPPVGPHTAILSNAVNVGQVLNRRG